jgi:hypothetical protein
MLCYGDVTEHIRGLNFAEDKRTTVIVTRPSLWRELLTVGQELLCQAWTDRGLVYIVNTHLENIIMCYTHAKL